MTTPRLGEHRPLTNFEARLVSHLIELSGDQRVRFSPGAFWARDYLDNAPGSFLLIKPDRSDAEIKFGRELVRGEFTDIDGVSVSVALNLDQDGTPFEVDIWKVDDTQVIQWPDLKTIKTLDSVDESLH